jgi:hypothetical protein
MISDVSRTWLRAVITQAEDEFIVSACIITTDDVPALVGEEVVPTLDAAKAFIEQLARQIGCPSDTVETIYNVVGIPPDASQRH